MKALPICEPLLIFAGESNTSFFFLIVALNAIGQTLKALSAVWQSVNAKDCVGLTKRQFLVSISKQKTEYEDGRCPSGAFKLMASSFFFFF